ncbi:MAG: YbhB/YbcL family Raf kinase inhibitor-like protein [Candidatus Protistobacter heckmanni]|nr:YbhB/YbcL family Raf kinase inhibitor-like protein [Candidatus Protistobacter heckmanni]
MKLSSQSLTDGAAIPGDHAFCVIDPAPGAHVAMSANRNPHLAWSDAPAGAKSFAMICDDDVPSVGDKVNKEGMEVPADLPRVKFYHWTLVDITARGKPGPDVAGHPGQRHGINDYTGWFAGDAQMSGDYYGYDGPCPPWNDARMHHYRFTVYALDVEKLAVSGKFTGAQAEAAMAGHVLAKASIMGFYTLNPKLAK